MPHHASRLESTLLGLFLLFLFWLPLPLGSNRDWSIAVLVMGSGALGLLWCVNRLLGGARPGRSLRAGLPMLTLLMLAQGWVCWQWLGQLSMDVGVTFQNLMLGISYAILFLLAVSLFHSRRRLMMLLALLVVSGTFQGFYGAYMSLSGTAGPLADLGYTHASQATGTFVNRNHLAGYLEMSLACGIGLLMALREDGEFRWRDLPELLMGPKARLRLALVIMVIALVMTHSRMGNMAFFVALLVTGGVFTLLDRLHRRRNVLILLSIVLIDILVISHYFGLEQLKERIVATHVDDVVVDGQLEVGENRDEVVGYGLQLVAEKPWTGHGAGAFEVVFPRVSGPDIQPAFTEAHNDYLQFVIEYGLMGSLPLAAFVLLAVWHAGQALLQQQSSFRSGTGLGVMMGILAIGIHSFTDFNLQIPANAATFVVLCAIAVLVNRHDQPAKHRVLPVASAEA